MELAGHRLPAGTRVFPSIYLTNRNPRVYEAPREFRPERFLDSSPDTFAWIPFGGGIRRCIGASFAQLEARLILRTVLSELEPSLPSGGLHFSGGLPRAHARTRGERVRRRAITLVPADGARVVWRRRSTSRSAH
jgi:cytochrome P450